MKEDTQNSLFFFFAWKNVEVIEFSVDNVRKTMFSNLLSIKLKQPSCGEYFSVYIMFTILSKLSEYFSLL